MEWHDAMIMAATNGSFSRISRPRTILQRALGNINEIFHYRKRTIVLSMHTVGDSMLFDLSSPRNQPYDRIGRRVEQRERRVKERRTGSACEGTSLSSFDVITVARRSGYSVSSK